MLVLDEPTAHLDTDTAAQLMDDVLEASAARTVLLITHRPEGLDAHGRDRRAAWGASRLTVRRPIATP